MKVSRSKSAAGRSREKSLRPAGRVNYWHGLFFLLGMGLMVGLQFVWPSFRRAKGHPIQQAGVIRSSPVSSSHSTATLPPWGQLEYTPITLEQPDDLLPETPSPAQKLAWVFPGFSTERLLALFASADLTDDQRAALTHTAGWQTLPDGVLVSPPVDLVLHLKPGARQSIYSALAPDRRNEQHRPFLFRLEGINSWFADSGLPADKMRVVENLIYTNNGCLCFCDLGACASLCSREEMTSIARAASRVSTMLIKVRVSPETNIEALMTYWGRGRTNNLKPFVESIAQVKGGNSISILTFLAFFARQRVYTYPNPKTDPDADREDCFWSSMNFFNDPPEPRFLDFHHTEQVVHSAYHLECGPRRLADLIAVADSDGQFLHMGVFVADDVVFTKIGPRLAHPWVLMNIADLLAKFPSDKPLQVLTFRRNDS